MKALSLLSLFVLASCGCESYKKTVIEAHGDCVIYKVERCCEKPVYYEECPQDSITVPMHR